MEGAGWSWRPPKTYMPFEPPKPVWSGGFGYVGFLPHAEAGAAPAWRRGYRDGAMVQAELGSIQGSETELAHTSGFPVPPEPGPSGCRLHPRPTLAGGGAVGAALGAASCEGTRRDLCKALALSLQDWSRLVLGRWWFKRYR